MIIFHQKFVRFLPETVASKQGFWPEFRTEADQSPENKPDSGQRMVNFLPGR